MPSGAGSYERASAVFSDARSVSGYTNPALVGFVSVKSTTGRDAACAARSARDTRFGARLDGTREENITLVDYRPLDSEPHQCR
jgi:hypothetical protein